MPCRQSIPFLTKEDQEFVINKIHTENKTSVVMLDEIRSELAQNRVWISTLSTALVSGCSTRTAP